METCSTRLLARDEVCYKLLRALLEKSLAAEGGKQVGAGCPPAVLPTTVTADPLFQLVRDFK